MKKNTKLLIIMMLSLLLFGCNKDKPNNTIENNPTNNETTNTTNNPKDDDVTDVEALDIENVITSAAQEDRESAKHETTTQKVIKHKRTGETSKPTSKSDDDPQDTDDDYSQYGIVEEEHEYFEDIQAGKKEFTKVYLGDDNKFHSDLKSEEELKRFAIVVKYYDVNGNILDERTIFVDYNDTRKEDPNFSFSLYGLDPDVVDSITVEDFTGMGTR